MPRVRDEEWMDEYSDPISEEEDRQMRSCEAQLNAEIMEELLLCELLIELEESDREFHEKELREVPKAQEEEMQTCGESPRLGW